MKCSKEIKNRISRANGQINGILNMIENEESCRDIVIQLKAVRASIDKTIGAITSLNLVQTIEKNYNLELLDIDEAVRLIVEGK